MPAKGKVNVNIQTLFCLVPVLDMVAAYRVKKLRKYLLVFVLVIGVPLAVVDYAFFPQHEQDLTDENFITAGLFYYGVDDNHFIFSIGGWIGSILFAMFLIRHWSNKWNEQFET